MTLHHFIDEGVKQLLILVDNQQQAISAKKTAELESSAVNIEIFIEVSDEDPRVVEKRTGIPTIWYKNFSLKPVPRKALIPPQKVLALPPHAPTKPEEKPRGPKRTRV